MMEKLGSRKKFKVWYIDMIIVIFLTGILASATIQVDAAPASKYHKDISSISGNITDQQCIGCHPPQQTKSPPSDAVRQKKTPIGKKASQVAANSLFQINSIPVGTNYSAFIAVGQTPYQLGPFFRGGITGWSWWDADSWGTEKQKNLIELMVFDNSTGTIRPVTGLATLTTFPQASFRNHSGVYSYKADTYPSPITIQTNYPDFADIWMVRPVDLRGVTSANLTFWTWYSMETDWDYGYVGVSLGDGTWTNLKGTLTTASNPNGNNLGNGITGLSSGWVEERMNLTPYAGKSILLGFRFKSDASVNAEGWYLDDISVTSGATTIFSDGSETPQVIKTLSVNVTYPFLTLIGLTDPLTNAVGLQYTNHTRQVSLKEDLNHPGTYIGYFVYDPFGEQYSGNYKVEFATTINGSPVAATTQFQTTIFGCQSCHNRIGDSQETSFIHGESGGMQSCMYVCHSGSRGFIFIPEITANPMHLHEMKYGHRGGFVPGAWGNPQTQYDVPSHVSSATCEQCHTGFIHDNLGVDTLRIANYTLFGTNISFSEGKHKNLTCVDCHGDLNYPEIPGNQYQLRDTLGDYNPSFTSHEAYSDTYIFKVNGTENLMIDVTGDGTTKHVLLHVVGPVDNTTTALQPLYGTWGGPIEIEQSLATPINVEVPAPYAGTWIATLNNMQEGIVNYTITGNYPVQRKPIIKIPECKDCHNSMAIGGAYTRYIIPDWNPGFAHADANGDGTTDVQCRMCHDAMHNITTRNCQDCHSSAPINHPVKEPAFSQYDTNQCLTCHGDPHKVARGETCIECHGTDYPGANPSALTTLVNISAFNESIHQDINSTPVASLTNDDCWMCHYNKDMNRQNVKKCDSCHRKPRQWHGNANITDNLSELW